ncbi:hypothetical protein [Pedobacter metabolipauper]|uniref:hypothetical protein n=1 Tax=Pedobacter metabolipauper TaxID=425513 RepID=UPI001FB5C8F5|nr:hypothetical protein [Pedobacter metabolipauper]
MKIKLTPLNLVSALCLVIGVLLLTGKKPVSGNTNLTALLVGFSFLSAVIAFISDLIFRKFIPNLKKLWVIEIILIIFIVILIFIIKASIS